MRKYHAPKLAYIFISAILLCFSFGYTYAYFSANAVVEATSKTNRASVAWYHIKPDNSDTDVDGLKIYSSNNTVTLTNSLRHGQYSAIQAQVYKTVTSQGQTTIEPETGSGGTPVSQNVKLAVKNTGDVSIYCRVKLSASYKDANDNTIDISEHLRLVVYLNSEYVYSEDTDYWAYSNGYYYLGESSSSLTKITKNNYVVLADYVYLSPNASADLYGKSISVTITVDAVQSDHITSQDMWI